MNREREQLIKQIGASDFAIFLYENGYTIQNSSSCEEFILTILEKFKERKAVLEKENKTSIFASSKVPFDRS